jgi:ribosome-interacting GTPase 1
MIEWWLPPMLRRADALLIVIDLNNAPLDQMVSVSEQLRQMRISLSPDDTDEDILSRQKVLVAGNKADILGAGAGFAAMETAYGGKLTLSYVSARDGFGLEEMKKKVFQVLGIIRVYTKTPGQKPDMNDPIILPRGSTLADAAEAVHKDFRARLKFARLWGSGKHDGIMVKRDHVLQDGDIIELHM